MQNLDDDILKAGAHDLEFISGSYKGHSFDIDNIPLDKQKILLQNRRFHNDTKDRRWLAVWAAAVVTLWLGGVFFILLRNHDKICLSDKVLMTLLGTTTLNVIGISLIVLRGHFKEKEAA